MMTLIEATNLTVDYRVGEKYVRALDEANLIVNTRETLGVVGESGSGKSTLGLAIGRLLPANAVVRSGDLLVEGKPVLAYADAELRRFRRDRLGFVFQSPLAALDPTRRVGRQLSDVCDARSAGATAVSDLLRRLGFADPKKIERAFPHELSGGMAQRVVVALAIARRPRIVVADEPTASLDSSSRNQVLDILFALPDEIGAAVVVFTHDLTSVARRCSHIAVMYAGRVVELGRKDRVLDFPLHPYTSALLAATPGDESRGGDLVAIAGIPPVLHGQSIGCAYAQRCPLATTTCRIMRPEARQLHGRTIVCHHAEQLTQLASVERP